MFDSHPVPPADGRVDLSRTVAFVLAGGQGTRLHELTRAECKPAVHFSGAHRIVDFTMANAVRSGLPRIVVATQYCPGTLARHLTGLWGAALPDDVLTLRDGTAMAGAHGYAHGYSGTADAVRANAGLLDAMGAEEVLVLAGDHVYAMDYGPMVAAHRASGASVTVGALAVPIAEAGAFGVIAAGADGRVQGFAEKPALPVGIANDPAHALISMGIYVFSWPWLRALLTADAARLVDFGHDVMPLATATGEAGVYTMPSATPGEEPYWRDVGTLDSYRRAVLEFETHPAPIPRPLVPGVVPRMVPDVAFAQSRFSAQRAFGGVRLCAPRLGAEDRRRWTVLDETVLMPGARVAPGVRLTRCIVAPGTPIPEGMVAGEDAQEDARWFRVTPGGTTLITTAMLARRHALRPHAVPARRRFLQALRPA